MNKLTEYKIIQARASSPFSLKNKIGRVIWQIIENTVFRYSPRPLFKWRNFLLKIFGAKIGSGVHIYPKVTTWAPWNIHIGANTGIANGVTLYSQGKIEIGERCVISQYSHLCTGTHDYAIPTYPLYTLPIIIKDDCWIAAEVFVHPGVTIEKGVVVGARSVVNKSLPKWAVYSGNPCKLIKNRTPY